MITQTVCPCCCVNLTAVNYVKNGHTYYRNKCGSCYRSGKSPKAPGWIRSGYKKKPTCERCGFKFKFAEQSHVYQVDGNLANNDWSNLRTICTNCEPEIIHSQLPWIRAAVPHQV